MTTCTAARIIGPAHDRTEIGCDLHDGHAGDHIQRDAFGRGSNVTYAWTRTTLRVVTGASAAEVKDYSDTHCYGCGERFERPLGFLTEEELETANPEHAVCFGEEAARRPAPGRHG